MSAVGGPLNWPAVPQIPLVDVKAQYAPLLDELKERIAEVLDSGRFILGPNVQAFEEEAAAYLGVKHAVGVANGTDALVLALDALEIGDGDEVICPSFTFYATAEAIARRGATPVFADIDPQTMNLDPERRAPPDHAEDEGDHAGASLRPPGAAEELAELGLPLIEDAAQAFGAPGVGTTGVVSTFSFFPTKNLFALGDGGLVATRRRGARRARAPAALPRLEGEERVHLVGYNSRLDELQAAALRVFLPHLDEWNRSRREAAARYAELGLARPRASGRRARPRYHCSSSARPSATGSRSTRCGRHRLGGLLRDAASPAAGAPLPRLGRGEFPETERASRENLALPMWAGIGADVQERVVAAVKEAVSLEAVR